MALPTFSYWDPFKSPQNTRRLRRPTPRWLSCWDSDTPTGSLLWNWLDTQSHPIAALDRAVYQAEHARFLVNAEVVEPRLAWRCSSPLDETAAIYEVSGYGGTSFIVRRADDAVDFYYALDPIYTVDGGWLVFRNLATVEIGISSHDGGWYTVTGASSGIVNDCPIVAVVSGDTEDVYFIDIQDGSSNINYASSQVLVPLTGDLTLRYQSTVAAAAVSASGISVNGTPFIPLEQIDLWNSFDGWGLRLALDRIQYESNRDYLARLRSVYQGRSGVTKQGLLCAVARELSLLHVVPWNGADSVNLTTSGYANIRYAFVDTVDPTGAVIGERLTPDAGNTIGSDLLYYSIRGSWLDGWEAFVAGRLISEESSPGFNLSGNILIIPSGYVTGDVTANYMFENYQLSRDVSGYVTGISAVSGNLASGTYNLLLIQDLDLWAPTQNYLEQNLLDSNGMASRDLLDLVENIRRSIPIQYGYARWSPDTYWFSEDEAKPKVGNVPVIYDYDESA